MIIRKSRIFSTLLLMAAVTLACDFSLLNSPEPTKEEAEQELASADLEATAKAMVNQMAQTSQARLLSMPPTSTQQPIAAPPTNTPQPTNTTEPAAQPPAALDLIQDLGINRNTFFCVKSDGPTTVTFTVEMSDIDRGMAIFWRLYEKGTGTMTEWKNVSMVRKTSTARTFTFDANAWDGTNNFLYPPGFGESWFQFQLISGDGNYRTSVYRDDITFFPCAQ